jgi:hypothetical protein
MFSKIEDQSLADLKLESKSKLIVLGDGNAINRFNVMFDFD